MTEKPTANFEEPESISSAYDKIRVEIDHSLGETSRIFLHLVDQTNPDGFNEVFLEAVTGGKRFRAFCAAVGASVAVAAQTEEAEIATTTLAGSPTTAAHAVRTAARDPRVQNLGVALELYQGAALVHDDIIDRSDVRRGRPSAHIRLASTHAANGFTGKSTEYGRDGAILLGDLLLAGADFALSQSISDMSSGNGSDLMRQYAAMTGEVAVGQFEDMRASYIPLDHLRVTAADNQLLDAALRVVRIKSARYSVVNPAVLGALAVGGGEDVTRALTAVLEPAGIAFQLRDDALGAFGLPEETGKPTGIDILEGKRTALLALTLESAPPSARNYLASAYGKESLTDEEVLSVKEILETYGMKAHEEKIALLVNSALKELENSGLAETSNELLAYLVDLLTRRQS